MYESHEIEISYKYLKTVVGTLEEPICLIGGWAVYHHVNKNLGSLLERLDGGIGKVRFIVTGQQGDSAGFLRAR